MTEQIFISYSKKDSDFANKLADDLSAAGFKIWIDRSIGGGDLWRETIEKNLKAAGEVIIVVSTNSMASEWVKHEGSLAYGWGKKLYPILIEKVSSLPPWLEEYQWIDFVNTKHETAFNALVAALTPPNPLQDLLDQQVQVCRQTGDLIGEAILRVVNENRDILVIDDEAQELIARSQHVIDQRLQREQQLIAEKEEARRSELQKAEQIRQLELYVARKKAEEAEEQRRLEEARAHKAENEARKASRKSQILRNSLVFSVILLVTTMFGAVWFFQSQPKQLSGDLNIAVAEFVAINNTDGKSNSAGREISNHIATAIEQEIVQNGVSNIRIALAYPDSVGRIDEVVDADRVANFLNADIVIFGHISQTGDVIKISPQFYTRSADSEIGELALFQPAMLDISSRPVIIETPINIEVESYVRTITFPEINIYIGQQYYTLGDFQKAVEYLLIAEQSISTDRSQYIETILGYAYFHLAEQEFSKDTLQIAQEHFQQALTLNPENPWAINGLGDTNYLLASRNVNNNSTADANLELAKQAEAAYQTVLKLAPPPAITLSKYQNAEYQTAKAYFGQGQIYLVEGLLTKDSNKLLEAKVIFDEIIIVYSNGNVSIKDLACQANARLGEIAAYQDKMDDAINYYKTAISLCDFEFYKAYYQEKLNSLTGK